jgi:D-alanyl-D-alanine carboxypeptidase
MIRKLLTGFLVLVLAAAAAGFVIMREDDSRTSGGGALPVAAAGTPPQRQNGPPEATPSPLQDPATAISLDGRDAFGLRFKHPPRAGLVFDMRTGRVLWRRNPTGVLPIASLTKMMTALLVTERTKPKEKVLITRSALNATGSKVGLLPRNRHVPLESLLYGMLLPSGNDAAIALAIHVSHQEKDFVRLMNRRALKLGLLCTTYVSPHGLEPGNRSCAADLAVLARIDMKRRRIKRIVGKRQAVVRFPIKGHKLYLNTTNPLLKAGYRGTIGLKTGSNDQAGHCLVAVVQRGRRRLGVVLLHSPDTGQQARRLLNAAFRRR